MDERLAVGVDIGGTKIAFALVNRAGEVLATHTLPTLPAEGADAVLGRVGEGIRVLLARAAAPVAGIGVGSPGQVDPVSGMSWKAVNLGWDGVPLRAGIQRHLPIDAPVFLQKDANAEALGEMYFGAAQGCHDFVYVGVGTGLGGGAVVNGEVVIGANFFPTEIGHMSLDPDGRQCGCGLRGCPEMYISGKGVHAGVEAHRVAYPNTTLPEAPTTGDILAAARAGDPLAVAVMEEAARWLGAILACCAGILNPALFVIGGGLGEAAGDLLIPGAERELRRRTLPNTHDRLRLIPSQVKSTAVGAACLVWHGLSRGEHMR